jgi:hypothetical protein
MEITALKRPKTSATSPNDLLCLIASDVHERAMISPSAGMAGRTYPGSFDWEMEKNTTQNVAHDKKKPVDGDRMRVRQRWIAPAKSVQRKIAVHGKTATSKTSP